MTAKVIRWIRQRVIIIISVFVLPLFFFFKYYVDYIDCGMPT